MSIRGNRMSKWCVCLLGPTNVEEPVQLLMKDAGKMLPSLAMPKHSCALNKWPTHGWAHVKHHSWAKGCTQLRLKIPWLNCPFCFDFNQFPCFYFSYVCGHLVCILALYLLMLLILIFFYNSWQSCHSARRVFRALHLAIVPGSQNTFLVPTQQGLHVASTACRPLNGLIAENFLKKKHFQDLATATVHSYCVCKQR